MMYIMCAHGICFGVAHVIVGIVIYGMRIRSFHILLGTSVHVCEKSLAVGVLIRGQVLGVVFAIDALLVVRLQK